MRSLDPVFLFGILHVPGVARKMRSSERPFHRRTTAGRGGDDPRAAFERLVVFQGRVALVTCARRAPRRRARRVWSAGRTQEPGRIFRSAVVVRAVGKRCVSRVTAKRLAGDPWRASRRSGRHDAAAS